MKITYHILWFEDDPQLYFKKRIEDYLEDIGFIPVFDKRVKLPSGEINFKKYNLILLDFHLSNEETTEMILKKINEKDYYSEIIFYSNKVVPGNFIKKNLELFEGVFWHFSDDDLAEKVKGVIDLTLKKFQDVNNLRGLVMAETSDLDKLKKEIFSEYFKLDHEGKEEFQNTIFKLIEESIRGNYKKIKKYQKKRIEIKEDDLDEEFGKNILNLIEDFIFDFHKKGRCIKKLIELLNSQNTFNFQDYETRIINKRNTLAHEPEREENGITYFGDLKFTPEECKNIRKDIREYNTHLTKLLSEIKAL